MGWWDTIKNFFGGHGVTVELTRIEGMAPDAASLPASDTVLKGDFRVAATKAQIILAHDVTFEAVLQTEEDGQKHVEFAQERYLGEDVWGVDFPYTIGADETVEGAFILDWEDGAIMAALEGWGYDSVAAAMADPQVKFRLTVEADVKGAVVDASAEHSLRIVEGTEDAAPDAAEDLGREAGIRSLSPEVDSFFQRFMTSGPVPAVEESL